MKLLRRTNGHRASIARSLQAGMQLHLFLRHCPFDTILDVVEYLPTDQVL